MNLQKMKPALLILSSLLLGLLSASIATAQSPWRYAVRDHADNLVHLARDARQETLHVAKHSQMLGPMLGEIGVMESNAAVLKAWASHREACYLHEQAEKIHHRIHRLASQLQVARLRSQSGLDRAMVHCGELERLIAVMEREVSHIFQDLPPAHGVIGSPVLPPSPGYNFRDTGPIISQRPAYQFGGPALRFSTGSGLQIQLNLGGNSNRNTPRQDRSHRSNHGLHNSPTHGNHGIPSQGPKGPAKKNAHRGAGIPVGQGTNIYGGVSRVQSLGQSLSSGKKGNGSKNKGNQQRGKRH